MSDREDHFVYWLYNDSGDCIYVGSSRDPERRWQEHYRRLGDEIAVRRVSGPFTRKAALAMEVSEQKRLNTKYNGNLKCLPIKFSTYDAWDCQSSPDEDVLRVASELLAESYLAKYVAKRAAS